jgi:hypothetical protein
MGKSCTSDASLESLDPYDQTLDSDDDKDRLRTVTQDEVQPSPVASHMTEAEQLLEPEYNSGDEQAPDTSTHLAQQQGKQC